MYIIDPDLRTASSSVFLSMATTYPLPLPRQLPACPLQREISESWGVLSEEGVALRGLFVIDKEGVVQHATINNLGFGRSVDETKRVLQVLWEGLWEGSGTPGEWEGGVLVSVFFPISRGCRIVRE